MVSQFPAGSQVAQGQGRGGTWHPPAGTGDPLGPALAGQECTQLQEAGPSPGNLHMCLFLPLLQKLIHSKVV